MAPNEISFQLTLKLDQINLILEGLGKLSIDRAEGLFNGIRQYTMNTLQQVEEKAKAEAEKKAQDEAIAATPPTVSLVRKLEPTCAPAPECPHPETDPDTK